MSDFTDTPFFAAPPMDDSDAESLVRSAMSIIGHFPRRSLVLLFLDGDTAGPCLRADIPYEVHDPDEWVAALLDEIPDEYRRQPAVLMCFEDEPQAEPEWFHELFLAVKRGLDARGIHSPELMWIATPTGERDDDDENTLSVLLAVESSMPRVAPETLTALEKTLDPLLTRAEHRAAAQFWHPSGDPERDERSFSLGESLRRRPVDEQDQPEAIRSEPNLIEAVLLVECLDLLLTRMRHGGTLAEDLLRSPVPVVFLAEHLSSVLGTELLARTAICGRRAAMATIQRRFRTHDDLDRAFDELPRYREAAIALAAEMLDAPDEPGSPVDWLTRLRLVNPTDFLGGEEAHLSECLPDPMSSVISFETHGLVLAESGFSDAIFTDVEVCQWEDLEALCGLCILLSRCTPPHLSRRLVGLALWSLWARGEGDAAADYAMLTKPVLGVGEDPMVLFVVRLAAMGVPPAAQERFPRVESAG